MPVYRKNAVNPNASRTEEKESEIDKRKKPAPKRPESPLGQLSFNQALFLILIFVALWVYFFEFYSKVRAIIAAIGYAIIEYSFYSTTYLTQDGWAVFKPFDKRCRKGFTVKRE
jgi:hypothetical protein